MDNTSAILTIIVYTAVCAAIVYAYIRQYISDKRAIEEKNRRNDLRQLWMRRDVDENVKHDMEFARYRLMRDIEKMKV